MTRIHKRIGKRIKRFAGHYTKYLLRRDTIFATIAVFMFLILLGMIPINFYVLNPMKMALKDFDFNDLAYAKGNKGSTSTIDSNIVIVNIGKADREELAYIIEKVQEARPKVVGIDAYFLNVDTTNMDSTEYVERVRKDAVLSNELSKHTNIVGASYLNFKNNYVYPIDSLFDPSLSKKGYANFAAEEIGTVRYFAPFEKGNQVQYEHFAVAIVHLYNKTAYDKLVKRHKEVEMINYSRRHDKYKIVEKEEVLLGNVNPEWLKDRIVLLGYVNFDPDDVTDKKFTPMNAKFAGKKLPDMNGVLVQANVISMILENNYINKTPKWLAWLFAIVIGWVHMSLFVRYYLDNHIWFHLVAKLAQVISVLFFAYLGILLFDQFRIKLDMKYTLYVIVLAVDIIYFYEAFAVWMHKKFGYHTLFHQHHHGH